MTDVDSCHSMYCPMRDRAEDWEARNEYHRIRAMTTTKDQPGEGQETKFEPFTANQQYWYDQYLKGWSRKDIDYMQQAPESITGAIQRAFTDGEWKGYSAGVNEMVANALSEREALRARVKELTKENAEQQRRYDEVVRCWENDIDLRRQYERINAKVDRDRQNLRSRVAELEGIIRDWLKAIPNRSINFPYYEVMLKSEAALKSGD